MNHYTLQRHLVSSTDAKVEVYQDTRNNGSLVAIKSIPATHEHSSMEEYVHKQLCEFGPHPNILPLLDSFDDNGIKYLVLKYCSKGDLFQWVETQHASQEAFSNVVYFRIHCFLTDMVNGLKFMHQAGFVHRDLSLENILIDDEDRIQICDFGLSSFIAGDEAKIVGKVFYVAPELLLDQKESCDLKKADMWSLGIILFMMLFGKPPFGIATTNDKNFLLMQEKGLRRLVRTRKLPHAIPDGVLNLLENLLIIDPSKRWNCSQVLEHGWMQAFQGVKSKRRSTKRFTLLLEYLKTVLQPKAATSTDRSLNSCA